MRERKPVGEMLKDSVSLNNPIPNILALKNTTIKRCTKPVVGDVPKSPAQDSSEGIAKVIYDSKDGKTSKTFDALDWLAQLVTHIPNKGEQMVRYGVYPPLAELLLK